MPYLEREQLRHSSPYLFHFEDVTAIRNLRTTTPSLSKDELERLNQSIDALLEMAFKDEMDLRLRHMKMVMIRGMTLTPKWVDFELEEHGTIKFLKRNRVYLLCEISNS